MNDPLKIWYLLVLEDGSLENASAFQGFARGWNNLHWAMHLLPELPADVLEPSQPLEPIIAQRIGGERQLSWIPVDISALEQASATEFGPFIMCFSGHEETSTRLDQWISLQKQPIFHLKFVDDADADRLRAFSVLELRDFCVRAFAEQQEKFSEAQIAAMENALERWRELELRPSDHPRLGHNIFLSNQMSLRRSGLEARAKERWMGRSEEEYTDGIIASVQAVRALREDIGYYNFNRLFVPTPGLILTEPAMFRESYRSSRPEGPLKDPVVRQALRSIQAQKGLCNETNAEFLRALEKSKAAQSIFFERGRELTTFTLAVGLRASSTAAAVMRLSPGVNHIFPLLDNYARHIRSSRPEARIKSRRLFEGIQNALKNAIGEKRLGEISNTIGPIKIISDSPLEWLDIDGLPLGLRRDCSRINATPGNVSIIQLARTQAMTVPPAAFDRPLVISAFNDDDPLRNMMHTSLQSITDLDGNSIDHDFRRVKSVNEFVEVLNSYNGAVLVFDGHGAPNTNDPIGGIYIGDEKVDVWQLRYKVRIPPIVILSACDTQSADAKSHATVGNGFLALGATTVVATLLPVGGFAGALFIGRLLLRLKEFLPAALGIGWRALTWTEVVAGMLRMTLVSEILDEIVGSPVTLQRDRQEMYDLQTNANYWINSGEEDWYDRFLSELSALIEKEERVVRNRAAGVIARSEAIRYVQLGNPETIRIADHHIDEAIALPEAEPAK